MTAEKLHDALNQLYDRVAQMRNEARNDRRATWSRREFDMMPHRCYGREQALSQVLFVIEEMLEPIK